MCYLLVAPSAGQAPHRRSSSHLVAVGIAQTGSPCAFLTFNQPLWITGGWGGNSTFSTLFAASRKTKKTEACLGKTRPSQRAESTPGSRVWPPGWDRVSPASACNITQRQAPDQFWTSVATQLQSEGNYNKRHTCGALMQFKGSQPQTLPRDGLKFSCQPGGAARVTHEGARLTKGKVTRRPRLPCCSLPVTHQPVSL